MAEENKKILVFAHMMKTAGTSLSKQLIGHYGNKMHIVPGGLKMGDDYYSETDFEKDLELFNKNLKIISGHPMRPYIDFGRFEDRMAWFTFFRKPQKRYVSHYLHDFKWTNEFAYRRYQQMKNKSIIEWEKIENYSNYQTKFLAGEENIDRAIEIIESKMSWIGLTEAYSTSIKSFKSYFNLIDFCEETEVSNRNLAEQELKNEIHHKYHDFILEKNQIDIQLYKYVKENIWPKYKAMADESKQIAKGKNKLERILNTMCFHISRQMKNRSSDFNIENIKRFYTRWYR